MRLQNDTNRATDTSNSSAGSNCMASLRDSLRINTQREQIDMSKAWILTKENDIYIGYGDTMDLAINSLDLGHSSVTAQRIPELDNLEIIKRGKKTIEVNFNGKPHSLRFTKWDKHSKIENCPMSVGITILPDGRKWYSYASDIDKAIEAHADKIHRGYSYCKEILRALILGLKAVNHE